jgi:hypothetical protein
MKKLALCFSGHPRTYKSCFESIKLNLLDIYNCDIFISSYNTNENDNLINLYKPKKYIFRDENEIKNQVIKYINQFGMVKHLNIGVFEKKNNYNTINCNSSKIGEYFYREIDNKNFHYRTISEHASMQFFGITDVSKLCFDYMSDNKINYDYILRLRFDDNIYGNFILYDLNENELLVNHIHNYSHSLKIHDHFYMAKPETYFKFSNIYNDLLIIINFINNNKCWIPTSGYQETIFFIQAILNNLTIKSITDNFSIHKLNWSF